MRKDSATGMSKTEMEIMVCIGIVFGDNGAREK